jgi:CheY-like chemotaxis protein
MHILVVDDDPLAGEMTSAVLEGAGHTVTFVENAIEASQRIDDDDSIALIISDMNMPMISGIELFRELREQGNTAPFILLTGDDPDSLNQQEPRLDACLLKDFSLEDSLPPIVDQVFARHASGT